MLYFIGKSTIIYKLLKLRLTALFTAVLCLITAFDISVFSEDNLELSVDYILGDVDGNGKLAAADARLTLRYSSKLEALSSLQFFFADYDENGDVTSADARYILRASAGLEPFYSSEPSVTTPEPIKSKIINAPIMGQYPKYPSGCESVAAVMNLNYYGINVTVDKFIDSYLPTGSAPAKTNGTWYSSDPNEVFLGDPRSDTGWGIWAKGLTKAINKCLDDHHGNYNVVITYSETLDSLCEKYIVKDIPVLVWVTAGMKNPYKNMTARIVGTSRTFTWISPNHCMLLVGYDETGYYFNDPITGKCEKYRKTTSNTAFVGNGSQAIVIMCEN